MPQDIRALPNWARRYGLAICCLAAPLAIGLIGFNWALQTLTPDIASKISIDYKPAEPKSKQVKSTKQASGRAEAGQTEAAPAVTAAPGAPAPKPATQAGPLPGAVPTAPAKTQATPTPEAALKPADDSAAPDVAPDPVMFLRALHYRGEARYAAASTFIYLVAAATFVFAVVIIYQRLGLGWLFVSFTTFTVLGYLIAFCSPKPRGRELVVENVLDAAEKFPTMLVDKVPPPQTGEIVSWLVSVNTIVSLMPVGMLLMALAGLSIRPPALSKPNAAALKKRKAELNLRRMCLRIALGLGSALLVIGVLANKALVEWPLSLVSASQALALQPLADAVTVQLGAMGTIATLAAFAPAVTAWWLDAQDYREASATDGAGTAPAAQGDDAAQRDGALVEDGDQVKPALPPKKKPADGDLVFAPMGVISGILAALAPLLASPFVDALKSVLVALGPK